MAPLQPRPEGQELVQQVRCQLIGEMEVLIQVEPISSGGYANNLSHIYPSINQPYLITITFNNQSGCTFSTQDTVNFGVPPRNVLLDPSAITFVFLGS